MVDATERERPGLVPWDDMDDDDDEDDKYGTFGIADGRFR